MPRLTTETKMARRLAITKAATSCFLEKGYSGTSMADIVRESGMSSGSIYSHFSSKEGILRAVVEGNISTITERVRARGAEDPAPSPRFLASALSYKSLPQDRPSLVVRLMAEAGSEAEVREVLQGVLVYLRELLAGQLAGWADVSAPAGVSSREFALLGADKILLIIHGFALRNSIDPDLDPESFLQQMMTMLPD